MSVLTVPVSIKLYDAGLECCQPVTDLYESVDLSMSIML